MLQKLGSLSPGLPRMEQVCFFKTQMTCVGSVPQAGLNCGHVSHRIHNHRRPCVKIKTPFSSPREGPGCSAPQQTQRAPPQARPLGVETLVWPLETAFLSSHFLGEPPALGLLPRHTPGPPPDAKPYGRGPRSLASGRCPCLEGSCSTFHSTGTGTLEGDRVEAAPGGRAAACRRSTGPAALSASVTAPRPWRTLPGRKLFNSTLSKGEPQDRCWKNSGSQE